MKSGKVTNIVPGKDDTKGKYGTMHTWWVKIDNGDNCLVATKPLDGGERRQPWNVGDTAYYSIKFTNQSERGPWHKISREKAPDAPAAAHARAVGGPAQQNQPDNDPDRQHSIVIQAFLKSIIESGAAQPEWEPRLNAALLLHDSAVAKRKVMSNYKPEGHAPQGGQPVYQPPPAAPVAQEDDDQLPF